MTRFSSLRNASSEARRILRERFASKLHVDRQSWAHSPDSEVVADDLVLRLLTNLTIVSNAEWSTAESVYARAKPTTSEPVDLQALAEKGWLRRIWGRVRTGRTLRLAIHQAPAGAMDALQALMAEIHYRSFEFDVEARSYSDLDDFINAFEGESGETPRIVCRSPEWVAARLWEAILAKVPAESALRQWVDLWELLQTPSFVPQKAWGTTAAKSFREAALHVLEVELDLRSWKETRDRYVIQTALAQNSPATVIESYLPPLPSTPVEMALWTQDRAVEGHTFESLEVCGELFSLVSLLLADVASEDQAPAPHPVVRQLFDLAIDRTELFVALLFEVQAHPRLLADLAIDPRTSGLVCLLIAQWRSPASAWDRGLIMRSNILDQAEAFEDAVSILGEHLRMGKANGSDAAALLCWLHGRASPGYIDDVAATDALFVSLRGELAACESSTLLAMARSLDVSRVQRGIGAPEFAAMLDICDLGGIEDEVDGETIIGAYVRSIAAGDYSLSTHRIRPSSAAALFRVAEQNVGLCRQFLYPVNVRTRLAEVMADTENEFTAAYSVGRSLRAHIRILCRAVIGGPADVSAELLEALIAVVRAGALDHKEKGRVAAFSSRHEGGGVTQPSDRPLAFDLAAVLNFVHQQQQSTLLSVILETDEPLILAQLLLKSPSHLRPQIEARIAALAPADAGTIHSLLEMQARIRELISAGATEAAARYMEAEENLKTWGPAPGRELTRFQNRLQLHCLREDWAAIADTAAPNLSSQQDQMAAVETLQHFRAIAALRGPHRNPEMAKATFLQLFTKRPSWMRATNWFAAALTEVLHEDHFGLLMGGQIRKGQKVLAEVVRMTSQLEAASGEESEVLECNRALLLLALSEPSQALVALTAMTFVRLQDTAAAYRAVAYARLGQQSKATAELDTAEYSYGRTSVLAAARAHIASGAAYLSVPNVSVFEDLIKNVAAAIARFRTMDPMQQANVLQPEKDSFEVLLIDYVRGAADALVSLVPMMKGVRVDSCEDDLNALIQRMLGARVQFQGWSVGDQSKGGFTDKGNPGERDILVTWGNSVLSVIEAVICDRPVTQDAMRANLESHFQKLLGYSHTRIFFHLTYAYVPDPKVLLQFLESSSETACPVGFVYQGRESIPHEDSRPPGFVASYAADFRETVKVVFLVLNLGQQRQRNAAKVASDTKERRVRDQAETAKYSDGNGQFWSGRGRRPQWMTTALNSGKSLDDFLVTKDPQ